MQKEYFSSHSMDTLSDLKDADSPLDDHSHFQDEQANAISAEIHRTERRKRLNAIIRYTILIGVGLLMIYPLLWLIGASFKTNQQIFTEVNFWPKSPIFSGYIDGWKTSTEYTFGRFFTNTFLILIPKVIATAISSTLVAYGFARFEFPGKKNSVLHSNCYFITAQCRHTYSSIPSFSRIRMAGYISPPLGSSAFRG